MRGSAYAHLARISACCSRRPACPRRWRPGAVVGGQTPPLASRMCAIAACGSALLGLRLRRPHQLLGEGLRSCHRQLEAPGLAERPPLVGQLCRSGPVDTGPDILPGDRGVVRSPRPSPGVSGSSCAINRVQCIRPLSTSRWAMRRPASVVLYMGVRVLGSMDSILGRQATHTGLVGRGMQRRAVIMSMARGSRPQQPTGNPCQTQLMCHTPAPGSNCIRMAPPSSHVVHSTHLNNHTSVRWPLTSSDGPGSAAGV